MEEHTIDAQGRTIGRVASEAAHLLRGKHDPSFRRHIAPDVKVHIINASYARIDHRKMKQKEYRRYSGYPSGLKRPTMEKVVEDKGYANLFEKAVYGMLPANRLRPRIMKKLTVSE